MSTFYDSNQFTYQFIIDTSAFFYKFDIFITSLNDIVEKWRLCDIDTAELRTFKDLNRDLISSNENNLIQQKRHCVVFGKVNSGKSTLINALLSTDILPMDNGEVTNSFVEIKKSDNNANFVLFPDNPNQKEHIGTLTRVSNGTTNHVAIGSHVKVFLSHNNDILADDVVITDTPGFDMGEKMDDKIKDICNHADIFIYVIDVTSSFSTTEKEFVKITEIPMLKIIFVLNKCDQTNVIFINNCKTKVKEYCEEKNIKTYKIFLLSANERLRIKKNESVTANGWQTRNMSFDEFKMFIKTYISAKCGNRLLSIMTDNIRAIANIFEKIKQSERLLQSIKDNLIRINELKPIINTEIDSIFEFYYEYFFHQGLVIIRNNTDESNNENVIIKLKEFINEQMIVIVESLKIIIAEHLSKFRTSDNRYVLTDFDDHYFANSLRLTNDSDVAMFYENYKYINERIKIFRGITVAGLAVPLGGGAIAAAAVGGVVVELSTAIAVPVFTSITGTVVGGGVGMGTYFFSQIKRFERFAYKERYKDQEDFIKAWYVSKKQSLINSHQNYIDGLTNGIASQISTFENDFNNSQTEFEAFKRRFDDFKNFILRNRQ